MRLKVLCKSCVESFLPFAMIACFIMMRMWVWMLLLLLQLLLLGGCANNEFVGTSFRIKNAVWISQKTGETLPRRILEAGRVPECHPSIHPSIHLAPPLSRQQSEPHTYFRSLALQCSPETHWETGGYGPASFAPIVFFLSQF